MKPAQGLNILTTYRRISIMVLLFIFCIISINAQKPDSILQIQDSLELIPMKAGADTIWRAPLQPSSQRTQQSRENSQLADSSLFAADTIIKDEVLLLADSTKVSLEDIEHSPRKAVIYSIIMPGLGQAYNKKYWKIPIVYAALGGAGYAIYYNTTQYRSALSDYADAVAISDPEEETYKRWTEYWRRNMELSIIAVVLVDALAVVDAYVDANLFYWDVDPDLTIRLEPDVQPLLNPGGSFKNSYGFRASFTF